MLNFQRQEREAVLGKNGGGRTESTVWPTSNAPLQVSAGELNLLECRCKRWLMLRGPMRSTFGFVREN